MSRTRVIVIGVVALVGAAVFGRAFIAYSPWQTDVVWTTPTATSPSAAASPPAAPVPAAAPGGGKAEASEPAPHPVLAEIVNQDPPVTVQVVGAKRPTPDTLRVDLLLVSRSTAPGALDLGGLARSPAPPAASSDGNVATSAAAHGATSVLGLSELCLLTTDGSRRLFALRDAEDKPVGGGDFAPLAPGERRAVWALFPAPPAADTRVTLLLGGLTLPNIQISANSDQP
jgi:hypothetical protein